MDAAAPVREGGAQAEATQGHLGTCNGELGGGGMSTWIPLLAHIFFYYLFVLSTLLVSDVQPDETGELGQVVLRNHDVKRLVKLRSERELDLETIRGM